MDKPIKFWELAGVIGVASAVGLFCKFYWPETSTWLEFWAFLIGAIAVYFQTVEHMLSWPTWIVSVALYAYFFHEGKLFADRDMQVIYVFLSIHGWLSWRRQSNRKKLEVTTLKPWLWLVVVAAIALGTALYYPSLVKRQDPAPILDGFLTSASIVTQILLNRKIFENWILWVVIDGAYVWLYITREYYATAILYGVFTVLAVVGCIHWRKSLNRSLQAT